ncbi:uncharacterized protein A4U43_C08F2800 [Asparagus officinalis]|nr:uncharacterized protein A4U43_C08F2800 [Asparagus officinalis]
MTKTPSSTSKFLRSIINFDDSRVSRLISLYFVKRSCISSIKRGINGRSAGTGSKHKEMEIRLIEGPPASGARSLHRFHQIRLFLVSRYQISKPVLFRFKCW